MLTNEQCTRLATELWGLYLDEDGRYCEEGAMLPESSSYIFDARGGPEFLTPENLSDEANSWEGFGRTVEAMAPEWQLTEYYSQGDSVYRLGFINVQYEFYPIRWAYSKPLELIPATHLAALEALK